MLLTRLGQVGVSFVKSPYHCRLIQVKEFWILFLLRQFGILQRRKRYVPQRIEEKLVQIEHNVEFELKC